MQMALIAFEREEIVAPLLDDALSAAERLGMHFLAAKAKAIKIEFNPHTT